MSPIVVINRWQHSHWFADELHRTVQETSNTPFTWTRNWVEPGSANPGSTRITFVSVHMKQLSLRVRMYCVTVKNGVGGLAARFFRCFRLVVGA